MTSDPTKPLCVFELDGEPCGKPEEHWNHGAVQGYGQRHPYTPPAETGRTGARKKVYEFMMLPFHVRVGRAQELGVYLDTDANLSDSDVMVQWVKRAKEKGIANELLTGIAAEPAAPVSPPQANIPVDNALPRDWYPGGQNWNAEVAPVSPEPPLNVRLKGDKDKGRFCIHGVELIKWCKICDGTGTVGATPEPESKADQQWLHLVAKLNTIHAQLQHKPSHLKCGHRQEIGSILNAYREGNLSFDEAKLAAQSLPSPAPQDVHRLAASIMNLYETRQSSGYDGPSFAELVSMILAASPAQPVGSADTEQK